MIYRIRINSFLYNQVNPVILSEIFIISRKMRLTAPYSIPRIPTLSAIDYHSSIIRSNIIVTAQVDRVKAFSLLPPKYNLTQ